MNTAEESFVGRQASHCIPFLDRNWNAVVWPPRSPPALRINSLTTNLGLLGVPNVARKKISLVCNKGPKV